MQAVFVGDKVRVVKLERPTPEDRSEYVGKNGLIVQKMNVPWTPDLGSLWRVRFFSGGEAVFAENEIAVLDADGTQRSPDLDELKESWGDAPRTVSMPFKRRFGANTAGVPALLAVLVFAIAGALLLVVGISQAEAWISVAGGVLVLIGLIAGAVLVT